MLPVSINIISIFITWDFVYLKLKMLDKLLYCLFVGFQSFVNGAVVREVDKNNIIGDGRPLTIKAYPAVQNYQSDLYEVFQEPFNFDIRQQAAVAFLTSHSEEGGIKGEVVFVQKHPPGGPIFIRGNITGLSEGKHGLHIQQAGDLREGCDKLGGHFNPFLLHHGGPRSPVRHVGDLGNVEAKENGVAEIVTIDPLLSLFGGPKGIVGRALVVTENEDDLGRGENANSLVDGNAGKPIACGIIAYIR